MIQQCAFGGEVIPSVVQGEHIATGSPAKPIEFISEGPVMKPTAHTFSEVTPLCAQYYHRYQTVESHNPSLIIENVLSNETIINTYTTQRLAFYQHAENEINFFPSCFLSN